jgi:membrane-associated HD superfamily phosphohydrolase
LWRSELVLFFLLLLSLGLLLLGSWSLSLDRSYYLGYPGVLVPDLLIFLEELRSFLLEFLCLSVSGEVLLDDMEGV